MGTAFYALDAWTTPGPHIARGDRRYRDAAGRPLTGLFRRDFATTALVTAVRNGRSLGAYGSYRFVRFPAPPATMLRWRNLAMCGAFDMPDEFGKSYLDADMPMRAVLAGQKPAGSMPGKLAADTAAKVAADFEIAGDLIGCRVPLGELFDLQAIADYYATAALAYAKGIGLALSAARGQTPVGVLQSCDWRIRPPTPSWC